VLIVKWALGALTITLILVCGALTIWMQAPVTPDHGIADPALAIANSEGNASPRLGEAFFEYEGRNLHYVYAGEAGRELVLFIHGFPSFWFSFIRQIQAFKADYRVVAIDGLGAGRSDAPHSIDAYTLEAMTAHLRALIDHLDADRVHLVGHDWGAVFALGFAQRYPESVVTVTGLSAPPQSVILELLATDESQHETFAYVETLKKSNAIILMALGFEGRIWDGAYAPRVAAGDLSAAEGQLFRRATSNPKRVDAHINWYRANIPAVTDIQQNDYWPSRKARLIVPALFIWGSEDPLITPAVIAELESIADDIQLLPMQNVGHWPHVERADTVNASIRALLSNHRKVSMPADPAQARVNAVVQPH